MTDRRRIAWIVALIVVVNVAVKGVVDLYDVRVTRADAPPAVARALAGTKLVFLSDIHVRSIGARERFVLDLIERESPDYVLIAGDLKPYEGSAEPSLEFFRRIRARRGAFAVLGDAEYRLGSQNCVYCHAPESWAIRDDLPVRVLRDQTATLAGADGAPAVDLWAGDVKLHPKLDWAQKGARPVIAMAHLPESFPDYARAGADLMLAGDTHGGQTWLPRPLYSLVLGREKARWLRGRFALGESVMWVNVGLGWTGVPLRFGLKPEVVIFDFRDGHSKP